MNILGINIRWPLMWKSTHEARVRSLNFDNEILAMSLRRANAREDALEEQLAQSRKNDTPRDPSTGRFMRKN